ncbi:MAG: MvaI/BcnI family restriction endonuclease [bacterium]|nr:MvaI/BcnI family restriction endonuclease [bacterium]
MERHEAIVRIQQLEGQDLVAIAHQYNVTVWKNGKLNKGWCGHTIERHLGLPLNSSQSPNFGSWELKVVPLKRINGKLVPKETMAITMIDEVNVRDASFEDSHLLAKMQKILIVAREFESKEEKHSTLVDVAQFDLTDINIINQVRADYELVQSTIKTLGYTSLTGKMGVLIQPRTKGPGHGSTSRAFYARKGFVKTILDLK